MVTKEVDGMINERILRIWEIREKAAGESSSSGTDMITNPVSGQKVPKFVDSNEFKQLVSEAVTLLLENITSKTLEGFYYSLKIKSCFSIDDFKASYYYRAFYAALTYHPAVIPSLGKYIMSFLGKRMIFRDICEMNKSCADVSLEQLETEI